MRSADFRKEGILNEANIQLIIDNNKTIINRLLKITTAEEFISIFDDDSDGFLNEDEQIMVFTIISHRIAIIAEELCRFKKYELYKDLMKEVRQIETQINSYQNELRQNVHKRQLDDYNNIGNEMLIEFNEKWVDKDNEFENKAKLEITNNEQFLTATSQVYRENEENKINSFKIKPNYHIKLLSNQEKLVALNERVEEAVNFRNELIKLQKKDEERLIKQKNEMIQNLNKKIDINMQKERKKLQDKINKQRNNQKILKNKETDVLNKQIKLHETDIKQIQNSISNMYLKIGRTADELNRTKERQRRTNETLAAFKSIKSYSANPFTSAINKRDIAMALLNLSGKTLTLNSSMESSSVNKFGGKKSNVALKYMLKNLKITRFDINSEFNNKKFCNVSSDDNKKNDNILKRKIKNLLEQRHHKDEIMIPPSLYYDYNLNLEVDAKNYRVLLPKIDNK